MAKQLQLRRGTTAQHSTFTGAVGEVTIDTDKDVVVVHDGATVGGFPSQKQLVSGTNIKTVNSTTLLGSGDIAVQPTLVSGTNIKTINSTSILTSGNLDLVAKVSSIEGLASLDGTTPTVIVTDLDRGGTFIWSSTGTVNGGTVFAGATGYWNRQYDGAINIRWFGAIGDGVTDDTLAIQNAINFYVTTNKTLTADRSVFLVSNTINLIVKNNIDFGGAIFKAVSFSGTIMTINNGSIGNETLLSDGGSLRVSVKNFRLLGDDTASSKGIVFSADVNKQYVNELFIESMVISGFDTSIELGTHNYIMKFINCTFKSTNGTCVYIPSTAVDSGENINFHACLFSDSDLLFNIEGGGTDIILSSCSLDYSNRLAVLNKSLSELRIISSHIEFGYSTDSLIKIFQGSVYITNTKILMYDTETRSYTGNFIEVDSSATDFGISLCNSSFRANTNYNKDTDIISINSSLSNYYGNVCIGGLVSNRNIGNVIVTNDFLLSASDFSEWRITSAGGSPVATFITSDILEPNSKTYNITSTSAFTYNFDKVIPVVAGDRIAFSLNHKFYAGSGVATSQEMRIRTEDAFGNIIENETIQLSKNTTSTFTKYTTHTFSATARVANIRLVFVSSSTANSIIKLNGLKIYRTR